MNNISPIDGRYKENVSELERYFSEQALMRHRVMVEVEYLLSLIEHKSLIKKRSLSKKTLSSLRDLFVEFSEKDFKQIKNELKRYSTKLSKKKELVILNKVDLMDNKDLKKIIKEFSKNTNSEVLTLTTFEKKSISKIKSKLINYAS